MLVEVVVENYAVIERDRLRFHPGLNLREGKRTRTVWLTLSSDFFPMGGVFTNGADK
jgi:hypothetical protein